MQDIFGVHFILAWVVLIVQTSGKLVHHSEKERRAVIMTRVWRDNSQNSDCYVSPKQMSEEFDVLIGSLYIDSPDKFDYLIDTTSNRIITSEQAKTELART